MFPAQEDPNGGKPLVQILLFVNRVSKSMTAGKQVVTDAHAPQLSLSILLSNFSCHALLLSTTPPNTPTDPATWTEPELRRWLTSVRTHFPFSHLPSPPGLLFFLLFVSAAYLWFYFRLRPKRMLQGTKHVKAVKSK